MKHWKIKRKKMVPQVIVLIMLQNQEMVFQVYSDHITLFMLQSLLIYI